MVTPVTSLILDRWGNVTRRTEVGDLGNGLAASIRNTFYEYNADNKVISAELGFAPALRADGTSYTAIVTHQTHYDLAGRAVEQLDIARDTSTLPGSVPPSTLRTRSTTYDGIGQVVEEKDAEQLAKGSMACATPTTPTATRWPQSTRWATSLSIPSTPTAINSRTKSCACLPAARTIPM